MSRNHSGVWVLALLLVGIVASVSQLQRTAAADSPTLTINADGSITPSTTLITSTDNVIYTLTENIVSTGYYAIDVQRDNIILDGAGYAVQQTSYDWRGINLGYRNNVTVRNLRIVNCGIGMFLDANTWLTIDNCTFEGNRNAVSQGYALGPRNFTFTNNRITAVLGALGDGGPNLGKVYDGVIAGNTVQQCDYGLIVYGGDNVTVRDNVITECAIGLWPLNQDCTDISIFGNTFSNNGIGVCKITGTYMTLRIYHNYFINNAEHARAELVGSNCSWDNGYPAGGNYWSGYVSSDLFSGPYQNVTGGDGVGDHPYVVNWQSNYRDRYPFMFVSVCNVSQTPSKDTVFSTDEVRVNATVTHVNPLEHVILNCTYSNGTATWTSSVNMTNLEDGIWSATIPSLPVGTNVTYTIIARDNAGNSISSTDQGYTFDYPVIVPEFPATALLPMLFTATLVAALLVRRKRTT